MARDFSWRRQDSQVQTLSQSLTRQLRTARPRRGAPRETRERLIAAAAKLFNRCGYDGTDSNRIARAAGYATGTFYKHFQDKKEVFLAAYETWVSAEWKAIQRELSAGGKPHEIARRFVSLGIGFHTRWRGLRTSLLQLVFVDAEVRQVYRAQRRRQLDTMARLRASIGGPPRSREEDAIHLFTTERTFDAIAGGEIQALGLDRSAVVEAMIKKVLALLTSEQTGRSGRRIAQKP
jgi:AcrR family transcriptional regulator